MPVLYLNSQNKLNHAENLSEGTVAEPSDNDDKITEQIKNALKTVGITLQYHLVIAGGKYFSYRQTGYLE